MALAPDFAPVDLQQADIDSYAGLFGDLNADEILLEYARITHCVAGSPAAGFRHWIRFSCTYTVPCSLFASNSACSCWKKLASWFSVLPFRPNFSWASCGAASRPPVEQLPQNRGSI